MTLAGSAAQPADEPSLADAPDETLVAACVAGDRDAFDVIVERHRRQIYNLVLPIRSAATKTPAISTQDVFIRAYRSLAKFKQQSSLGDLAVSESASTSASTG